MTTLIQHLQSKIKANAMRGMPPLTEFTILKGQVAELARHVRANMRSDTAPSLDELEHMIIAGQVTLLGIKVKVLGG